MLLDTIHYELQLNVISVQGQQNKNHEHTGVVAQCGILCLSGSRSPNSISWWCVIDATQTPRVVQVDASPPLGREKQDCRVLVRRIRILGNSGGMGSVTVEWARWQWELLGRNERV